MSLFSFIFTSIAPFLFQSQIAFANSGLPLFFILGWAMFLFASIWVFISETCYLMSTNRHWDTLHAATVIIIINAVSTLAGAIFTTTALYEFGSFFPHPWNKYISDMPLECKHIHVYQTEITIAFTAFKLIFAFVVTVIIEGWLLKKLSSIRNGKYAFFPVKNKTNLLDSPYKISLNMNTLSYSGFIILGSTYWLFGLNFPFNIKPDPELAFFIVQLIMIIAVIIWYRRTKKSKTLIAKSSQEKFGS